MSEPAGSLAAWLRQESPRILRTWEQRARREVGAAKHHKSPVLQNDIRAILDRLVEVVSGLSSTPEHNEAERRKLERLSFRHGAERANLAPYCLEEVIFEYHILRETIFEVLEEHRELTRRERDAILGVIDQAANDAASEFSRVLRDFERIFVLTLVHDLRNPINAAMMGIQYLLRDGVDPEKAKSSASMAHRNLQRLSKMVTDLLDASRVRAGGVLALEMSDVDLKELVLQVAEERLSERLRVETSGGEPLIGRWNRDGLRRVVENLTENAFKFGDPETPVTIKVTDFGTDAILSVHNEGDPIPPEERNLLFKEFSRANNSKSKKGWGIGLVLVKGMIDAHHGTISVESEAGKGTTFEVRLPK